MAPVDAWMNEAVSYAPLVGVIALAFGAMLFSAAAVGRARHAQRRAEAKARALASELDATRAVLWADPGAIFLWPVASAGQDEPRLLGRLTGFGNQAQFDGWRALLAALLPHDAERLLAALAALREHGAMFSLALSAKDGRNLEAEGRITAGQAVLWLRDGSLEHGEILRLGALVAESEQARDELQSVLDNLPVPLWRRDARFNLVWANAAYARAVDAPSVDAVLETQAELDGAGRQQAQRARRERKALVDSRALVIDGERKRMDVVETPDGGGTFGFALDMTALEEARHDVERYAAANRDTLDHLHTAVAIFGADRTLKFFNRAYAELWRLDDAFLQSMPSDGEILEALREARRLPEQANFPAWKRRRLSFYNKVIEQGDELWHLPDGRTLRVVVRHHPLGGLIYLYEDVTDRLALESSHKLLAGVQRATLDNLYEGVALFGSDGRLQLYNPAFARIWSFDPHALEGAPHFSKVTQWCRTQLDDTREWERIEARVTSLDPERRALTGRIERRDGAVIDYAGIALPDGATLLSMLDVTASSQIERALRERNDALEAADRIKSDFVSHVSYQLRTPLNTIIGFATMLDRAFGSEPLSTKQSEFVGHISLASNQLLRLIDDIIDLATIEAGRMSLDLGEMDVQRALESAVGLAIKRAQETRLSIELKVDPGVGRIVADERRLKQVVFNLLQNAIAFTPPGGRIRVIAERTGSEVRIAVSDTGQGIAPRLQPTVFDRFESRGSDGRRGAGLGLSLVKSFIQLHGGWVELQSKQGEGTTVTCHLPSRVKPQSVDNLDAAE